MNRSEVLTAQPLPAVLEACPGIALPRRPEALAGPRRLAFIAAVFLLSFSVLAFEIALTRLFAAVLAYHFVFAAVSIGLLGLGLGGVLLAGLPREEGEAAAFRRVAFFALGAALSLVAVLVFFLRYAGADRLFPLALASLPPFLFAGLFLALGLRRFAAAGSRLYFADLAGAATGALGAVLLLQLLGPPATVLLLAGIIALAAALAAGAGDSWRLAGLAAALGLLAVGVAVSAPRGHWLQLDLAGKRTASKHLLTLLSAPERRVRPVASSWDAYARTDIVDVGEGEAAQRVIFTDGGGASLMPKSRGTGRDAGHAAGDPGLLPFLIGGTERVLIIGPGGGHDVLLALLGGAKEVTAVEVNPAAVRAVESFADYNGGLYRYRNVRVVVGEGRNYVRRAHERYDLIYLPLVMAQAVESFGYSLVENYVFTMEAFRDYLAHLRPGGRLVIKTHALQDLTRAFVTALAVLERQGRDPATAGRQFLAFQGHPTSPDDPRGIMYPLLILRDTPYAQAEAEDAFTLAVGLGIFPLFVPGVQEMPLFTPLLGGGEPLKKFVDRFPQRIDPTSDDSPFFYEYSRPLPTHLLWLLGGLGVVLIGVVGLAGVLGARGRRGWTRWSPAAYFGALGGGFMLVEIPVLQRSILALGYPTLAFSVVLFAFLTGAGIGSYFSAWLAEEDLERAMARASLATAILAEAWLWGAPFLLERWTQTGLLSRSLLAMALLFPLGFAAGIPFPLGIRLLERNGHGRAIPWMWAVNGVASVLASVGAVLIALAAGFSWAMGLGAVLYVVAAGSARFGLRSGPSSGHEAAPWGGEAGYALATTGPAGAG